MISYTQNELEEFLCLIEAAESRDQLERIRSRLDMPAFIERDPKYFEIACRRIEDAQRMQDMFAHDVLDAYEMTAQQADLLEGAK